MGRNGQVCMLGTSSYLGDAPTGLADWGMNPSVNGEERFDLWMKQSGGGPLIWQGRSRCEIQGYYLRGKSGC